MPNKKINALDARTAVSTDLMLVGDPATGTAYKSTLANLPLVPYTGATGAVNLGAFGITAASLMKSGGTSSQFLKADGSVDGTSYTPTSRTLTINGTTQDLSADRTFTIATANIYNADGTLTGNRTLTHGGFSLSLVGSTHTNRFTSAGRLLLGTTTESTFLLDVNGTARVTGTGTSSTTTALLVRNSTGTFNCLKVRDDGKVAFGNSTTDCTITGTTGSGSKFEFYAFNGYDFQDGFGVFLLSGLGATVRFPRSVGVGFDAQNNSSAVLQADSTTKGFLPPRMTTTQINAIATPAEGLMAYNTTISHMCVYQAGSWAKISHSPM